MRNKKRSARIPGILLILACAAATAAGTEMPRELSWEDLIPPRGTPLPTPPIPPAAASDAVPDNGAPGARKRSHVIMSPFAHMYPYNPVTALNGKYVKLPGFIVPLESDEAGLLNEFLLVPYVGACIHVPPPPSNQIVYVKLKQPYELKSMNDPVWITGTIVTTEPWTGDLADADYAMAGDKVEKYVAKD